MDHYKSDTDYPSRSTTPTVDHSDDSQSDWQSGSGSVHYTTDRDTVNPYRDVHMSGSTYNIGYDQHQNTGQGENCDEGDDYDQEENYDERQTFFVLNDHQCVCVMYMYMFLCMGSMSLYV